MAEVRRRAQRIFVRRQQYRLRETVKKTTLTICPEWLDHAGVYEGDIDPSSQDFHELRIRLFCPGDPDCTFLAVEEILEEVD